jgi:hypothetical protein
LQGEHVRDRGDLFFDSGDNAFGQGAAEDILHGGDRGADGVIAADDQPDLVERRDVGLAFRCNKLRLLICPRIDHANVQTLKVTNIACGEMGTMGGNDAGDERVANFFWTAHYALFGGKERRSVGGLFVEVQDAIVKSNFKNSGETIFKMASTLPFGVKLNAEAQLENRYGGGPDFLS